MHGGERRQSPARLAESALLDPALGALDFPIRSEIFGVQRFEQHAVSLGQAQACGPAGWRQPSFVPRLKANIEMLRLAHRAIAGDDVAEDASPAATWLLDNFHLVEAQLEAVRTLLPRRYFRSLPVLAHAPLAGLPRVYGVGWAFVAHTDSAFDADLLVHFLCAYQRERELHLGELWALPTTLRVLLVENLRRVAERAASHQAARALANRCCDALLADPAGNVADRLQSHLPALERRGLAQAYLGQLAQRLYSPQGRTEAFTEPLRQWLHERLPDPAALQHALRAEQAANDQSVSNALRSLRAVDEADWPVIVARSCAAMQALLRWPLFAAEDSVTRDNTLHAVEACARRHGLAESAVARALLARVAPETEPAVGPGAGLASPSGAAALAGHWLAGPGRTALLGDLGQRVPPGWWETARWKAALRGAVLPLHLGLIAATTAALVLWLVQPAFAAATGAAALVGLGIAALAAALPASEIAIALINRLVGESKAPSRLPRLALESGLGEAQRTLVAIPALLSDTATIDALVHRLLLHHLANREGPTQFALLGDWNDAPAAEQPGDAALLQHALTAIGTLNREHPVAGPAPRFLLLHRARRHSVGEDCWLGWERKRGKLEQLMKRIVEGDVGDFLDLGRDSAVAVGTHYVLSLDSDTQLPPGTLRALLGIASHPAHRPVLTPGAGRVAGGYGVLQPRTVLPLSTHGGRTPFHWLFAGQPGHDPYGAASSEVYQDLYGEGSYTGKGLLHAASAHAVLGGRLPEDRVLSHDLLEGALLRCAVVSDIAVIEDAPGQAAVADARAHRWLRGDWQLLPFLFSARWPLGALNRWKMLDNLRRSLVAPASLGLLMLSAVGGQPRFGAVIALVLGALLAGPTMAAVAGFAPSRDTIAKRRFYRYATLQLLRAVLGGLYALAQLLPQALRQVDAIVRALHRQFVSHRHCLEWTTTEASAAQLHRAGAQAWGVAERRSTLIAVALWAFGLGLLAVVWALAPWLARWASRPWRLAQPEAPTAGQAATLHDIARDTWRYFERTVGPADRHLPPDNLQLDPSEMLARRTSPTNIGLYLLSAACAREFGWIGTVDLMQRLGETLSTLERLPRHRGHFYNWYDTATGAPLLPMYVSTVDSGNLSGHLLATAQACRARAAAPLDSTAGLRAQERARQRLAPLLARRTALDATERAELRWQLADRRAARQSAARDAPVHRGCSRGSPGQPGTPVAPGAVPRSAARCSAVLLALAGRCEALAWQPEFGFLYNAQRRLLHIGLRVADGQLDAACYDLLSSESRLASLVGIAKGELPVQHWAALGRPYRAIGALAGLRSWSGSMFEYLMPTLVLAEPRGSLLNEACRAALRAQIDHAAALGVPWGLSESAHAERDRSLAYQYGPQGVPTLALRRTPPAELVVAPYATALAAQLEPRTACRNWMALQALGVRGRFGFIEALDYTRARQPATGVATPGRRGFVPVLTYMAHHQGMSIVAMANVLLDGVVQRWGQSQPHLEAVAPLLHERAPAELPRAERERDPSAPHAQRRRGPGGAREIAPGFAAVEPTQLLANGRYGVTLRANGAGHSHWGGVAVHRWRDDLLRDACGHFIHLRRADGTLASLTQHPAPDAAAHYGATFHADRVVLDARWPRLRTQLTVWVCPEDDIEFRRVEIHNRAGEAIELDLISAFEPTLSDPRADEAHPAFANLFLEAAWLHGAQALRFVRRPRREGEAGLGLVHFIAESEGTVLAITQQTDRAQWLGRGHDASRPQARMQPPPDHESGGKAGLASSAGTTAGTATPLATGLDPICALGVRLRIGAGARARITFATAVAHNAAQLDGLLDTHARPHAVERASRMSATLADIRLRALRISPQTHIAAQQLCTALLYTLARPSPSGDPAAGGTVLHDRRVLWPLGLSGERAIVLIAIDGVAGLGPVRALAQALRLWAWGGVACDLVCIDDEAQSYPMALRHELLALRERHGHDSPAGAATAPCTALHVFAADALSPEQRRTLHTLARASFVADGRNLHDQVVAWSAWHERARERRQQTHTATLALPAPSGPDATGTPAGSFEPGSGAYLFDTDANQRPPRPWINVLANPQLGCHVSESGAGCSWAANSRLNRLTAWSNDPVTDPAAEWFVLQDLATREAWNPFVAAAGASAPGAPGRVHVRHEPGRTRISQRRGDLDVAVTWCVDASRAVKQVRMQLRHHGRGRLRLRVSAVIEWMLGAQRADRASTHTAWLPPRRGLAPALTCTQQEASGGFGGGTAFLALASPRAGPDSLDWTTDRRECWDARGAMLLPDHWGRSAGPGLDPVAALSLELELAGGGETEIVFLIGWAETPDAARALIVDVASVPAAQREQEALAAWDERLGATEVLTPDPLFDALVNRWLLYQVVACRMWAKAGFYQAGGATGFRDQLQDSLALAWSAPALLRAQILEAASRQFREGDVQHWWHRPGGAGVRTRFSDDLLWLPLATLHHLHTVGDGLDPGRGELALLDEQVPFLEAPLLAEGAEDRYDTPTVGAEPASVYEHGARALDHSLRVGVHGLPLMGGGDWNDGMNRVGIGGRGESVWLAWFGCTIVEGYAPLAVARGEHDRAERWRAAAAGWRHALQGPAWDGAWFRRAFFDDGQVLGGAACSEARIDLMAQTWAVLSDATTPERERQALAAVDTELVDETHGLVRLLHPPLHAQQPDAGYIQAYPPGVRENGGQYAHAAVWLLLARARLAQRQAAAGDAAAVDAASVKLWRDFCGLSPAHRSAHPTHGPLYGLEPYVVAGDICSAAPYAGRGGWSWYTGAAAWLHRASIEAIFGLDLGATTLCFRPCLPLHWPRAELRLRRDGRELRFVLLRGDAPGIDAACRELGARVLAQGEPLDWRQAAAGSLFVVPLPLSASGPQ